MFPDCVIGRGRIFIQSMTSICAKNIIFKPIDCQPEAVREAMRTPNRCKPTDFMSSSFTYNTLARSSTIFATQI
jgi:hypothetical protein